MLFFCRSEAHPGDICRRLDRAVIIPSVNLKTCTTLCAEYIAKAAVTFALTLSLDESPSFTLCVGLAVPLLQDKAPAKIVRGCSTLVERVRRLRLLLRPASFSGNPGEG